MYVFIITYIKCILHIAQWYIKCVLKLNSEQNKINLKMYLNSAFDFLII